jgi:predicted Zn-dependent protease
MVCKRGLAAGLAVALIAASAVSCWDEDATPRLFLITAEQEQEIGKDVHGEIALEYKLADPADPASIWAKDLVAKLADASKPFRDPAEFGGFKVAVIVDDELVNAFAAPGGYTYIATGLVKRATTCAEITGVLGHELGHVAKRHGVKKLERSVLAATILDALLGKEKSLGKQVAGAVWNFLQATKFSQVEETESDQVGLQIAYDAGYNPYGLRDFFQVLLDEEKKGLQLPEFLSSHPATGERIKAIEGEIGKRYGDKVKPETTQTYDCVGTALKLAEVQKRIADKAVAVQAGTGTGATADAGDAAPTSDAAGQ